MRVVDTQQAGLDRSLCGQRVARRLIARAAAVSALAICGGGALAILPPAVHAEECPNAAFRVGPSAHLPDCRAYELVSPSYKAVGSVRAGEFRISPDGTSDLLFLTSAIEGDESLANFVAGVPYPTQRTAAGWTSAADELPASGFMSFLHNVIYSWMGTDLDGETNVYTARAIGQAENRVDFFERLPDHAIADVGPGLPPSTPPGEPYELASPVDLSAVGMSADGSRLLFALSGDFWPGDGTEERGEVLGEVRNLEVHSLYEYLGTGNTVPLLVGVNDNGEQISRCGVVLGAGSPTSNGSNGLITDSHNAMSADGNTVFFTAYPDNYENDHCTASASPVAEVFARIDNGLPGAHTVAISEPSKEDCAACDTEAGVLADAHFYGASEDGSKVLFATSQPLLGSDTSTNLYEYDFDVPAGQRIVRVSGGDGTVSNSAAEVAGVPVFSEDGSHVYFIANGVLTRTPNAEGETAEPGAANLYVFERDAAYPVGRTEFIARLSSKDQSQQWEHNVGSGTPSVTPDGRFLVFTSNRDLTPDDAGSSRQAFEYDAQTGALVRVSIGADGFNHNGNVPGNYVTIPSPAYHDYSVRYEASAYWSGLSVSANGAYVFFESPAALTPQALNEQNSENVYEYHDGQVSLISDGQDDTGSVELLGTDESGADVFFTTADSLAPQDTDSNVDVYDARIDGGIAMPNQPACSGEECQGELSGAPTLLSPGSEFQAGGNPPLAAASGGTVKAKPKATKAKRKSKRKREKKRAAVRGHVRRKRGRS